ncbi:MAG: hypothetical protein QOE82_478 [Thermoanaerobaculia bacterium]|nr:hypothetical protein [Thermoanaerobaculia bacterium]
MEHTGFPSDETLAAFIDGRLDPETRSQVISHMTTCSECYSVFVSATEMPAEFSVPAIARFSSRYAWLGVGGAALAAALAVVLLVTPLRERVLPHGDDGMALLAKAAPKERTIFGRISGFPYQPMAPVMRSRTSDPMKNPANAALLTASAGVQRSVKEHPTAANLHASGVANLLLGSSDTAIDLLHQSLLAETGERTVSAAIDDSDDVALLNDLSVALSNRAALKRRALPDAAEALKCADRAWRVGQTPEAAWNRAVATEALNGSKGAQRAWREYLAIDPTSPWAAEANKRIAN